MNGEEILRRWDRFIERRGLPYYENDHRLMMRQVLDRYPFGKLADLSDEDLRRCVHAEEPSRNHNSRDRAFRYFINHFDRFLELHDRER